MAVCHGKDQPEEAMPTWNTYSQQLDGGGWQVTAIDKETRVTEWHTYTYSVTLSNTNASLSRRTRVGCPWSWAVIGTQYLYRWMPFLTRTRGITLWSMSFHHLLIDSWGEWMIILYCRVTSNELLCWLVETQSHDVYHVIEWWTSHVQHLKVMVRSISSLPFIVPSRPKYTVVWHDICKGNS